MQYNDTVFIKVKIEVNKNIQNNEELILRNIKKKKKSNVVRVSMQHVTKARNTWHRCFTAIFILKYDNDHIKF
jgi:hypothetical protein